MTHPQTTLGVISDTHSPQRLRRLPEAVFSVLEGVDLIVHAGDVGDLSVLDRLSKIAPVIAVHGNDESSEATAALPYLQVAAVAGHRVLVTHGHFNDPLLEQAQRSDDSWYTSFSRWASHAHEHGATVMIYGHSHVPSVAHHGGVWLINGGALASANIALRQSVKTVARVTLTPNRPPNVVHYDLAQPDVPHQPPDDYEAGFSDFYKRYTTPIFEPELMAHYGWIREELLSVAGPELIFDPLLQLAHECWEGTREFVTAEEAVALWKAQPTLPHFIFDILKAHPLFGKYL